MRNPRIAEIASAVFKVPIDQLDEETGIGSVEGWDSLAHLEFIFRVEEALQVRFPMSRILGFATLGDFDRELERLR